MTRTSVGKRAAILCVLLSALLEGRSFGAPESLPFRIRLDHGHPWRPPFGLERIGGPIRVVVEAKEKPLERLYTLSAARGGREVGRTVLRFSSVPPHVARVAFEEFFE